MTKDELIAELVKTLEDAVSTLEVFSPHPSQTKLEQILWGDVSDDELVSISLKVGMYRAARDTLHNVRLALASAEASVAGDGWRPIESAPKDDSLFLVWCPPHEELPDGYMMIWNGKNGRTPRHPRYPATHWCPFPSPPSQQETG